jgi:hypothetical protein
MKIYFAGNMAMAKDERPMVYDRITNRLLSYFELLPGRFGDKQWKWLLTENWRLECKDKN